MTSLSRRNFLQLCALTGMSALLPAPWREGERLGRAIYSLRYFEKPTTRSAELGFYNTDAILRIWQEAPGEPEANGSRLWVRTPDGWVNGSYVQPVAYQPQRPVSEIPAGGFLGEITVPLTQSWRLQEGAQKRGYRFYYGSTHWVTGWQTDTAGKVWYHVPDDLYDAVYLVAAEDMRRVPPEELTPIHPEVGDKHLEVDLQGQRLTAWEGSQSVFSTRIATGYFEGSTPQGSFRVERKQPYRHMALRSLESRGYDLPGVPWVCFIHWNGVSFHGTYWHNAYGFPQSHGCINLTPAAAKWVYRWTTPVVASDDRYEEASDGTPVEIY
jgi:hypothetical protein